MPDLVSLEVAFRLLFDERQMLVFGQFQQRQITFIIGILRVYLVLARLSLTHHNTQNSTIIYQLYLLQFCFIGLTPHKLTAVAV